MTLLRVYKKNGSPVQQGEDACLFSDSLHDFFGEENFHQVYSTPKVNIREEKEYFELEIALPGVSKKDILINVEKDSLNISHKELEKAEEKDIYSRREFDFSQFKKSFYIPKTINSEMIQAKMDNGILTVKLPKREEAIDRGPREITIS
ncbi:MAG: Hsp20/alpha crystallin family protein [Bacteroidota bacterium]